MLLGQVRMQRDLSTLRRAFWLNYSSAYVYVRVHRPLCATMAHSTAVYEWYRAARRDACGINLVRYHPVHRTL